jgi:hypothetical protein
MKRELGLLNLICLLVALGFLAMAIVSVFRSGDFLTIDNLFIIAVSLVMALLFAINPLLYLKSEGRLPLPFVKRTEVSGRSGDWGQVKASSTPPLLDAKGRAVPPDVKAIVSRLGQSPAKDT